jgi:hypothetical protein
MCDGCVEVEVRASRNRLPVRNSNSVSTCESVASSCGINYFDLSCWYYAAVLRLGLLFGSLVEDTLCTGISESSL